MRYNLFGQAYNDEEGPCFRCTTNPDIVVNVVDRKLHDRASLEATAGALGLNLGPEELELLPESEPESEPEPEPEPEPAKKAPVKAAKKKDGSDA